MTDIGINFGAFETLLEVVVDGIVGNFAEQCQIRNSNLLLLRSLKGGLLGLGASTLAARSPGLSISGSFILGSSGNTLHYNR